MRNKWHGTYVEGTQGGFDFDAHYTQPHGPAVAWVALGWEPVPNIIQDTETDSEWLDEDEPWRPDFGGRIAFRMVGDDQIFYFDAEDMIRLDEEAYCAECGQVGCTHDGRDRAEV